MSADGPEQSPQAPSARDARLRREALERHPSPTLLVDLQGDLLEINAAGRALLAGAEDAGEGLGGWRPAQGSLADSLRQVVDAGHAGCDLILLRGGRRLVLQASPLSDDAAVLLVVAPPSDPGDEDAAPGATGAAPSDRAEARLRFALDAASLGIWELDMTSGQAWRSPRHDMIFGYTEPVEDWTFEIFMTHVLPQYRDSVRQRFETGIANREPYRFECRIQRVDGRIRWIAAEGAPHLGPDGTVVRLNGIVSDITEAKEAEARINNADRMESLGQMAGGLAHDFSNIIGIVRLQAEVASLTRDTEAVWARLDAITRAAERGAELAARTLAFARREPGVARPVALKPLIEQVVDLSFGDARGTILIDQSRVADLQVQSDAGQLENAILNLLLNARDAIEVSGRGSVIEISACRGETAGQVAVAVVDNGPGMTPDVLAHATDPFFTTKESAGGTGLGLSTVAAFCTSAGGGFELDSVPGRGTRALMHLPEAQGPHPTAHPRAAVGEAPAQAPLRLLLVEDQTAFRDAMELMLKTMGHRVTGFESAGPALAALEGGMAADVLVTDVLLPGEMSGFDLARAAAALRPLMGVLYVSGYVDALRRDGAPEGVFLRKPVDREALTEALEAARPAGPGDAAAQHG